LRKAAAKPFAADRFVQAFRSHRELLKQNLLHEVERLHLHNPALPEALWEAIRNDVEARRFNENLFRAIRIHGHLSDPRVVEQQISLLAARDSRVVLTAVGTLAERCPPEALTPILQLSTRAEYRTSYGFRNCLVSAAGEFRAPASVDFLIETVSQFDGQLRYEAARRLEHLTARNFGGRGDEWKRWRKEQPDPLRLADAAARTPTAAESTPLAPLPWDQKLPNFYGVPIYAKRIVFVIDRSRSMLSSVDGVTRLRDAQSQLEEVLSQMPEETWFDILAYDSTVLPWQGRLVQASAQAKSDALRFVERLEAVNKTACYDALRAGLALDSNLEALLFLSDGEPTAGEIVDPAQILQEITQRNIFQRTSISTIGIDATGISEQFLKHLAASNHGTYHSIR
jgi:hypothetical protein